MIILNPMLDFVFKALFGKEDKTSKKLLIAFLNDVLAKENQEPIVDVAHINPFNYKEFEKDKLSVLDIKAKTEKDEIINIEVQVQNEDNYRKRSLYYWSKSYGETILEAETYESLKKTIVINILGYIEITESGKIHTTFKIMEQEEHFNLLEDLQIHYLELPKLPRKNIEELDDVELWLDFLKESAKEGNEERLKELKERSEIMETAINQLIEISADEKMREIYRAREKARLDMISKLKYAENRGIEKGMEKGIEKGIEKGMEKGETKALARTAIRLLTRRFDFVSEDLKQRIAEMDAPTLEAIIDNIFEYNSPDDVKKYIR